MAYLGDYLGQILSEMIVARAQSDLETVRIAELYASHPLLKHFPVPHVRLPTVTLDLPYVVQEVEKGEPGGSARGKLDPDKMQTDFLALIDDEASRHEIKLTREFKAKNIQPKLKQFLNSSKLPEDMTIGVRNFSQGMAKIATDAIRESMKSADDSTLKKLDDFSRSLSERTFVTFLSTRKPPPRLDVLVTRKELGEIKNPEMISRLHLTISEEGHEWAVVESNGESADRLVPE